MNDRNQGRITRQRILSGRGRVVRSGYAISRRAGLAGGAVSLAVLLGLPVTAPAQVTYNASAVGQYQYNSNVFDLQAGYPIYGTDDYRRADSYYAYGAAFNVADQISQQNLYLRATDTEYVYDHFTQLTHDEYDLDGGLKWALGPNVDGTLDVTRTHTMVAFSNLIQEEIATDTEQRETARVGFVFLPDWRAEAGGYVRTVLEPLVGEPNLDLAESEADGALKYLGEAGLTAGVSVAYLHGSYTGTTAGLTYLNPSYDQDNADLIATYRPLGATGPSTFDGAVGYSDRTSPTGLDNISGITGHLDYNRKLTGKTSFGLALDRAINSYLTNSGSEITTSVTPNVTWQATYKIGLNASYSWSYLYLPDQGYVAGTNRGDHVQYAGLTVDYEMLRWLALKPYANVQTRKSNYPGANFNDTVYGVQLVVNWQKS